MSRDPDDGFRREVLPHLDLLYRFALSLTRDRADAADLVQETVLLALQGWRRFASGTNCRAWLLRIMRNAHLARGRLPLSRRPAQEAAAVLAGDASVGHELYPAPKTPEELLVRQVTVEAVRAAVEGLPPGYREVVVLKDLEGLAYREIAEVVGHPIGTVMSRLARGRNLLKSRLVAELQRAAEPAAAGGDPCGPAEPADAPAYPERAAGAHPARPGGEPTGSRGGLEGAAERTAGSAAPGDAPRRGNPGHEPERADAGRPRQQPLPKGGGGR